MKDLYKPLHSKWVIKRKKQDASELLFTFANQYFESLVAYLSDSEYHELLAALLSVLHSNRHNKEVKADGIKAKIDFSVVRDVLYNYTKKTH
jgi:hypothetical protein